MNNTDIDFFDQQYFLTCLAEECGEIMEILFLKPDSLSELELEINDLFGVAELLKEKKIIDFYLDRSSNFYSTESKEETLKRIYKIVYDIQTLSHKSLRFGIDNINPYLNETNKRLLEQSLFSLVVTVNGFGFISIYSDFDKKKHKVLKYLKISKENLI